MIRIIIIIIFFFLSTCKTCAQDPLFTQSFLVPETLNPSFISVYESSSAGLLHRSQWPNLDLKIESKYAFVNIWFENSNSGLGISVIDQRQNFTNYGFTQFDINYAYQVQLTDEWFFHPSIKGGYGTRAFNSSEFNFEDQIDILNGIIHPTSVESTGFNSKLGYLDFSTGMLFNNENWFFGTALKHFNRPNISYLTNGNVPLDMLFAVNLGYQFTISDYFNFLSFSYDTKLKLTSNYIKQGGFKVFDFEGSLIFPNYFFGVNTKSNLQSVDSGLASTTFSLFGGLNYEHFQFGYSYDFNGLKGLNTGGAYELSVVYRFDLSKKCYACPNY